MPPQSVELECPSCRNTQTVEVDECGADLDLVPCQGSDSCKAMLCPFCRVKLDCCKDLFACEDHAYRIDGEMTCEPCMLRIQREALAEEVRS